MQPGPEPTRVAPGPQRSGLSPVVVETRYLAANSLEAIAEMTRRNQWCLTANRARAVLHALDVEGKFSICVYLAPDAEALRRVIHAGGGDQRSKVWASTEHWSPPDSPRPALGLAAREAAFGLALRSFDRPTSYEQAGALDEGHQSCLERHSVRHLRSYLSLDQRRMLCLYAAPDLESVRAANRLSRVPLDDVLGVLLRDPGA